MKKPTLNFIINAFMFLCMSAIVGIGFLIKYTLISGQKRWGVYGDNVELYFLGIDRHKWGEIHLIIGFVLLGLLALHIILHWKVVLSVYNRIFQLKKIKGIIAVLFITICSLFIIIPFLTNPKVIKIEHGEGRQSIEKKNPIKKEENNKTKSIEQQEHSNLTIEIRGYMTILEISKKYKVPTEFIKTSLDIPQSISNKQRLSWLRKNYNIKMDDVEKIIKEYHKRNE